MAALKYLVALAALFAVLLPPASSAQQKDNAGKEFYVAFVENQGQLENENAMELYITSKVLTSVKVEVPALGFNQTVTSTPGAITTVKLPSGDGSGAPTVEITTAQQIVKGLAVHITSDEEITVYGMNHKKASSDAFMGIPVDVLGTEYITINYPTCSAEPNAPANGSAAPGEFWIVAVNDSTNVTITPKAITSTGSQPGVPIQVLLYKGDVYLVQGDAFDYSNDLTGSIIESDQPIAVLSGHVRAGIPQDAVNDGGPATSRDHLVEQLPPVSAWGDSALVVPYSSSKPISPDLVRIVSAEDDNTIMVNGVQYGPKLNRGDFAEIKTLTGPIAIHATNPILVGQYMHTSKHGSLTGAHGDPALALVFPVEQFNTSYTFISVQKTNFVDNYVNVVTSADGTNSISVDGKLLPASKFKQIPSSNFYYAQLNLDDKTNTNTPGQGAHNMTGTLPFGIIVYGLGPVDSYSYTGGSLLKTITPFKTVDVVIDFRDRLLTTKDPNNAGQYTNYWDSTVALQNISSDPLTINGFINRTNDVDNFAVVDPVTGNPVGPFDIGPGEFKNITIRFTPKKPDVREHTKITAQTEHLRAYVVDVFGRGILGNPQVYSDSATKRHIDTLDFGTFEQTDLPKDSEVFIANRSPVDLEIDDAQIVNLKPGTNPGDFSIISFDTIPNPVSLPFTLPVNSKRSAHTILRFTPRAQNGSYEAVLEVTPNSGEKRIVVLLAKILTIFKPTITSVAFDTVMLCTNQDRKITVNNSNDFEITVTKVDITPTPSEFLLYDPQPPFTVPAGGSKDIVIRVSPATVGNYSAQATISFNIPKGYTYTQPLNVVADQIHSSFKASQGIRALPNETIIFPIYAYSPVEVFKSPSFKLIISYDPTHLHDLDFDQSGTHTEFGIYNVLGDSDGYREYDYYTADQSIVTGGQMGDTIPLIKIKFQTIINPGEDPFKLIDPVDINYSINFDGGEFPSGCVELSQPVGRITIDSTCTQVPLTKPVGGPNDDDIEGIMPNPSVNGSMAFTMDVSKEGYVRLDVMDALGNPVKTIVSETYKPGFHPLHLNTMDMPSGTYYLALRTAGGSSVRKVIVLH